MSARLPYFRLFLAVTLVFMLSIMPLPSVLSLIRPLWVLVLMLYMQFSMPNGFRVGLLLLVGLTLDALCVSVMGQHAFALITTAWLATNWARRFNFFSIQQQLVLIALLCFVYQSILYLFDLVLGYHASLLIYVMPVITTTLLWPWVKLYAFRAFD